MKKIKLVIGSFIQFMPCFIGLWLSKYIPEDFKEIKVSSIEGALITIGALTSVIICVAIFNIIGSLVRGDGKNENK